MEGLILIALGAGVVIAVQKGRKPAKKVLGWVARQGGFLAGRVKTDIERAKKFTRDEFSRAREANPPSAPDVVVPSERVPEQTKNGNGHRAHDQ